MRTFLLTLSLASLAAFFAAGLNLHVAPAASGALVLSSSEAVRAPVEGDPWSGKNRQFLRAER